MSGTKGFNGRTVSERPMFGYILEKFLEKGTHIQDNQTPQKLQHEKNLVGITKSDDQKNGQENGNHPLSTTAGGNHRILSL
jgi:hypothetical protein